MQQQNENPRTTRMRGRKICQEADFLKTQLIYHSAIKRIIS